MKKMIILKTQCIKYLILSLFVWAFALPVIAGGETDTIIYREKNNSKWFVVKDGRVFKNKRYYSALYLDFGYNRLDKSNMFTGATHESASGFPKLRNSAFSSFAMYTMFGHRISGSLSIMSGLGINWVNYRFSKDVTIREINDMATQVSIESVIPNFSFMKKSKLAGSYLEVPLLLNLRFHRFFVAAGVVGGLNIGSHTKVVFVDTNGKKQTYKDYDIHLATFRYGYTVRAGFRCLSLFTNYYVSPLFAKDEGPQVYPFTMGISLRL
ncbi:MAG: PorT family protein [Prevotellaceae bacterium]|jgi:hypothetical protein|nr:PorT family protein [Prevotellaceae bacterium]